MKERYINLMERALSAYTDEHILRYVAEVRENGVREHGFPRLTANIGILIAHGRRVDLLPLFAEMMELCLDAFLSPVKAANEFSVREIVCCLHEIEAAGIIDTDRIGRWREKIRGINPDDCYTLTVRQEGDLVTNWAIFGAVSEYARIRHGLGNNLEFIDRQLSCQFGWLDENGMYRDNEKSSVHQPMVYDLVSRGLFALLLHFGYRGKYFEQIDDCLKKSAPLTLAMQSTNGEVPFGGRSNQFLHNEAWMMLIFEYEAARYIAEGNTALAEGFKSAAARALAVTEHWLNKSPIRHIKNRFPTRSGYGCEEYAYFDKYMITVASILYAAYLVSDDSIPAVATPDRTPTVFETTPHFHKLFLKAGGYSVEFDTNADPHYDSCGLGRVHREAAPSAICLSCPCPAEPTYKVDTKPFALSLSAATRTGDGWQFGADCGEYTVTHHAVDDTTATAEIVCRFPDGQAVTEQYTVDESGVSVTLIGDGEIGYTLPALCFDGEVKPTISTDTNLPTASGRNDYSNSSLGTNPPWTEHTEETHSSASLRTNPPWAEHTKETHSNASLRTNSQWTEHTEEPYPNATIDTNSAALTRDENPRHTSPLVASSLSVEYDGWRCTYTTDGKILDLGMTAANRNGHYRAFLTAAKSPLTVKIEIVKI